jgi:hypothetical protein
LLRHVTRYGSVDQYKEPAIRIPILHIEAPSLAEKEDPLNISAPPAEVNRAISALRHLSRC